MDTSGNLLVGTTNTGANHASNGAYITSSGQLIGRTTGIVSYLNRRGSDGQILQFMKDGTSVGSIGAYVSRLYVGNDDTFLTFEGAADKIYPATNTGAGRDNAIDLGTSGARFKDLYLSGGAYPRRTAAWE